MADAELAKAELAETLFGALHLLENLAGDGAAVFDPRGQTRSGGAVPKGIASRLGQGAHVELGKAGVGQRSEDGVLLGGALAGAEIASVVGIHAVGDVRETKFRAERLHDGEELVFAVETAIGVVALILGPIEFRSLNYLQRHPDRFGKGAGLLQIAARE